MAGGVVSYCGYSETIQVYEHVTSTEHEDGKRLAAAVRAADVPVTQVVSPVRRGDSLARSVATCLGQPVGRLVTRPIRVPESDAIVGAVASDGCVWFDDEQIASLSLSHGAIRDAVVAAHERARSAETEPADRSLAGRDVLVVADEETLAAAVLVAIRNCRAARAEQVSVVVERACGEMLTRYHAEADAVVCLRPSGEPELDSRTECPPTIRR